MIKTFLLLLLGFVINFSANAQWWKKTIYVRLPQIEKVNTTINYAAINKIKPVSLHPVKSLRSRYSYDLQEAAIMKELYHTLRFRMYTEAIDGLNRLVNLYIEENRYSEAKWYLLQCNYFGHKSKNNDAIIASLISLGMLKADIGEYGQARQDLLDAQELCRSQGKTTDASDIDKKLKIVEAKSFANIKNDIRYAELTEDKKG